MEQKIEKVQKDPNQPARYRIFLDNGSVLSVHEDVLVKHRLLKGMAIDAERIRLITREEEKEKAVQQAVRWLAIRARTAKEVERRLAERGFEADVIEAAIEKLNDLNYLNDQQFAAQFVRDRLHRQRKGRMRIAYELKEKGIDSETVKVALDHVDGESEWQAAYSLARSRWKADEDPMKRKRRLAALLARRGFAASLALKAIEAVQQEMGEQEQDPDEWYGRRE